MGAQLRTNDYSSNVKVGGEIDYNVIEPIWIIGFVDVVKSFYDGSIQFPTMNSFTGLYINDQEYGALSLKGFGKITDNLVLASVLQELFSATMSLDKWL
jgi:hypothetical protein